MLTLFIVSSGFVVYSYLGYPLLCFLRARLWPVAIARAPIRPSVSVLIAAHREAHTIAKKLASLARQSYPASLTEVVIVCDGSDDGTEAAARQAGAAFEARCSILVLPHGGKPTALNRAALAASGEVLIFTDARQTLSPDAIVQLVERLADPSLGAVSGQLVLTGDAPVSAYWKYEAAIRRAEGTSGSTIGVSGALYALRRELYWPLPPETILDDLLVPMRVRLRNLRVGFAPEAQAIDQAVPSDREFYRKVRTLAGNFQLLLLEPALLLPWRNPSWFDFCSHKLSRLLVPYALLAMLIASALLAHPFGVVLFGAQLAGYAVGILCLLRLLPRWKLLALGETFCLLNAAAVVGLFRFLCYGRRIPWR